jgi:hypothetical protein
VLGYTVGAGGELKLYQNWFLRAEYRFLAFKVNRDRSSSSNSTETIPAVSWKPRAALRPPARATISTSIWEWSAWPTGSAIAVRCGDSASARNRTRSVAADLVRIRYSVAGHVIVIPLIPVDLDSVLLPF